MKDFQVLFLSIVARYAHESNDKNVLVWVLDRVISFSEDEMAQAGFSSLVAIRYVHKSILRHDSLLKVPR
jgi:hypothetical protein